MAESTKISEISVIDLKPTDKLLVHVEVGTMLPSKVNEYLYDVRDRLLSIFGSDNKVVVAPMRNGVKQYEVEIIRPSFFGEK